MKLFYLIAILLSLSPAARSQSAPSPSQPTEENEKLIDSLMSVSGYKEYFDDFCFRQIDKAAKTKNWTTEQVNQKKAKVSFESFKAYSIYNWFSNLSKEELLQLINTLSKLNNSRGGHGFFISNKGMQTDLQIYVGAYLL